ncbi:MAG: hypothetical protein J6K96_08575 [Treponema sp.]|nr:hypothetical protein [Treponema sp.]
MPKGQTFLDEPVTEEEIRHLRVVITDANDDNEFLTVSIDTFRSRYQDASCIIQPGEHPFIKHTSFVNYRYAKVISFAKIFNGLRNHIFLRKEDVSEELLKKIQEGAKRTKYLSREHKIWFELF